MYFLYVYEHKYLGTLKQAYIYKAYVMAYIFYICVCMYLIYVCIYNQTSAYCLTTQIQELEPYFFPDILHKLRTKPSSYLVQKSSSSLYF